MENFTSDSSGCGMLASEREKDWLMMMLISLYGLIIAFKLRAALKQNERLETALKAERVHCQWLQQRLTHYAQPYNAQLALDHIVAPPGPRDEPLI